MQIFSYTSYQQAESIRWLFDISCDVRSSLGSTTQASCASSASCQPEAGNPWCSSRPRRARTVPTGLISWQRFLQCFNALLQAPSMVSPLVMLEAWKHTRAKRPPQPCEPPWGFASTGGICTTSVALFSCPLFQWGCYTVGVRNAGPWQLWRALQGCVSTHICHRTLPFQSSLPALIFN